MASLAVKVGVDVSNSSALRNLSRDLRSVGTTLTATVTAPIIGLGTLITKVATSFDTSLRQIVGLTDVTAQEIVGVRDAILSLSGEVGKTPQELADAFYFLASAGLDTTQALDTLGIAAKASAAGLGQTQDIAKVLASVLNAYGKENITAAQAVDVLIAAVKDGTAEADAFAGVLGRIVPTAAQMGVGFDQISAALAAMTLTGLSADEAATSLNQVLVSLLKPAKQAEKALEEMGTSSAALRKELKEKGLLATLRDLEKRFGDNDEAAALVFGNVRALRGALALLGLDSAQLNDIFADTANSAGLLNAALSATEGPGREFDRAMAEAQATLVDLGEGVLPIVVDGLHAVRDALRELRGWWASLDDGAKRLVVVGALGVAAIGPLLLILGAMASGLAVVGTILGAILSPVGLLIGAFLVIGTATGFFSAAIEAAGPLIRTFGSVLAVLGDLIPKIIKGDASIGSLGLLFEQFGPQVLTGLAIFGQTILAWIGQQLPVLGAAIAQLARAFIDWIAPMIPPFLAQLGQWIVQIGGWIVGTALPAVAGMLGQFAGAFIDWVKPMVAKVPSVLLEFATAIVGWLGNDALPAILPALGDLAKGFISGLVTFLAELPGRLWDFLINSVIPALIEWGPKLLEAALHLATTITEAIRQGLVALPGIIWDALVGPLKGAINTVIDIVNHFIRFWNGIKFTFPEMDLGPLGKQGGWTVGLPRLGLIPKLAQGAWDVPSDTLAFIHKGEMVVPADPAANIRAWDGGGAGGTVVVNVGPIYVSGDIANPRDKARQLVDEMGSILREDNARFVQRLRPARA